jgi:hypothetical protein
VGGGNSWRIVNGFGIDWLGREVSPFLKVTKGLKEIRGIALL